MTGIGGTEELLYFLRYQSKEKEQGKGKQIEEIEKVTLDLLISQW